MIGEEVLKIHLREWVARFARIIKEANEDPFSWGQAKCIVTDLCRDALKMEYTPSNLLENILVNYAGVARRILREMRNFEEEFTGQLEEWLNPDYTAVSATFGADDETLVIYLRQPPPTFDEYIERCRREGQHIPREIDVLLREWMSLPRS